MSLDANIETSTDLLGKSVSDLQENVAVTGNALTGTLKYVSDYTGFSGDPDLQKGNYLAIHVGNVPADAKVKVELIGGESGEVELDADRICIIRITDVTQTIKVEAIKGNNSITKVYSIADMVLTPAPEEGGE